MTFVIVNLVLFGKQRQQVKSRVLSMNFKKTMNQNLPNINRLILNHAIVKNDIS